MTSKNDLGAFFISGAGLNASIWDRVVPNLSVRYAVADHSAVRQGRASLLDYVANDEKQINAMNTDQVVIVAHSIGGMISIELLKRLGSRAAGLVVISGIVPLPGNSFVSVLPFPQNLITKLIIKVAGTKPPESAIRKGLCDDLSKAQADEIVRNFAPESATLYTDAASAGQIPKIKSLYIRTTNDKQFSKSLQLKMANRLSDCQVANLTSAHLPMISHSQEVADLINNFVEKLLQARRRA